MKRSRLHADGSATFFYAGEDAGSVRVTGSFCGWSREGAPMRRTRDGWEAEVAAIPGDEVAYKLIKDGQWIADPANLVTAPDGLGGFNSVLARGRGAVHHLGFASPALGQSRRYTIYLPPSHDTSDRRFPVLYLLHGLLDWERTWLERGRLAAVMDEGVRSGELRELIVVMPYENGDLQRGDGRASDYLARDVIGHVDYEFQTRSDARHRALDGLSTGGFTSLALAAERPEVWTSIGGMSGSYDERSFAAVRRGADTMRGAGQRHLFSCGLGEPHIGTCRAVRDELSRLGVPADWIDCPGGHDWGVWSTLLAAHLRFHSANLGGDR